MKKIAKICMLTFVFTAIMLVFMCFAVSAENKKIIHIVYDDTSGIYHTEKEEFTDKWSRMKNAVCVFASLTNVNDKIVVYPISGEGEKYEFVNNANPEAMISEIDSKLNGYAIRRSFSVVEKAWEDLKKENDSYEKWLVLICDGKFEEYKAENSDTSVQEKLSSYAKDGIRVVSQSVSNNGAIYNLKNDGDFYCYNANDAKEILQKTIEISNLIYKRAILNDEYIEHNKKAGLLEIDDTKIPMSEIIVIANGMKNTVSAKFSTKAAQSSIKVENPKTVPAIFENSKNKLKYASDLEKNILISKFESALQPGRQSINVGRSENVTVIYKADVRVELWLYRNGNRIDATSSISTGKYGYKVVALNPVTGKSVESPLLDGAVYQIRSQNQSNVTNLDKKEGEISFLKGSTRIETFVDLGTQKFSSVKAFYVFGDADFVIGKLSRYKVNQLNNAKPLLITVSSESLPENVSLLCGSEKNISFRVENGEKSGEFYVYPEYKNHGSYLFAPTGNIDIVVTVVIDENGEVLTYSKPASIYIENVPFYIRCIDWLWYYKWWLVLTAALVAAFLFAFGSYVKKKETAKKADEIIDDTEEIVLDESETKSEDTKDGFEK